MLMSHQLLLLCKKSEEVINKLLSWFEVWIRACSNPGRGSEETKSYQLLLLFKKCVVRFEQRAHTTWGKGQESWQSYVITVPSQG